ncbi:MAG TPA: hypothetical protein VM328_10515 [Fimbriimonadaceae bacterium]|nr:hypothetical protein [Fimbriimonadaceae bacterium]
MGYEAIYEGSIKLLEPQGYAHSLVRRINGEEGSARATLRITYRKDGAGSEQVEYLLDGVHRSIELSTKVAHVSVQSRSTPTMRPPEEGGGFGMLGFALPPTLSNFFLREPARGEVFNGYPCSPTDRACEIFVMPFSVGGAEEYVQWRRKESALTNRSFGRRGADWKFMGGRKGFPEKIEFREFTHEGEAAVASYELVSLKPFQGQLRVEDVLASGQRLQIERGGVAYGSEFDPNMVDPWSWYSRQEHIHQEVGQQDTPPWGLIGGITLSLALLLALAPKALISIKGKLGLG